MLQQLFRGSSANIAPRNRVKNDPLILRQMVFRSPHGMRTHYEELADGMQAFMERRRPHYVERAEQAPIELCCALALPPLLTRTDQTFKDKTRNYDNHAGDAGWDPLEKSRE
jgi:hypothetical protein